MSTTKPTRSRVSQRSLMASGALLGALTILTYSAAETPAPALTTLYSFSGENGDGAGPSAAVLYKANGSLYGTTSYGGIFNSGTVFELTPVSGGAWTETVLHSFGAGNDGTYPYAGVVAGTNGVLYGTTNYGGASGMGTVYELTPPGTPGGAPSAWTETVLFNFSGSDGAYPYASLTLARSDALYGTTELGGTFGYGTVFELTPPAGADGAWTETVLHNFSGSDGSYPYAVLAIASGTLYGTTTMGGSSNKGAVFKLTAPGVPGGAWTESVVHSFNGSDEGVPYGGVVLGANGAIYGTTAGSVSGGNGTVFELSPPTGTSKVWTESVLYKFTGFSDGGAPHAAPTFGPDGTLYGTTFGGGTGKRFNGSGLLFQLTPPVGTGAWTESVLYTFLGGGDGATPTAPLTAGPSGVYYSTTLGGGTLGQGTVFALKP